MGGEAARARAERARAVGEKARAGKAVAEVER